MVSAKLYSKNDWQRLLASPRDPSEGYRSEARRDYARVIHCPSFRRLQGKTQLFPSPESDFFRNRITHSLEVAQIAKSIAAKLNANEPALKKQLSCEIAEVAGLIHDLGHPPFGHNGEKALDKCMIGYGGFEGNAQTIRILTRLEKKEMGARLEDTDKGSENRVGLNLCFRTIAASIKYDREIPLQRDTAKLIKGYYGSEAPLVEKIKKAIAPSLKKGDKFKTIECQIMDIADDIAYSTYDLEDSFKAGFISPITILAGGSELFEEVAKTINKRTPDLSMKAAEVASILKRSFARLIPDDSIKVNNQDEGLYYSSLLYAGSESLIKSGYVRTTFTSELIKTFMGGIRFEYNSHCPALSKVWLEESVRKEVEVFKNITFVSMIMSPRLKIVEHRGLQIVTDIFSCLSGKGGAALLPTDYRQTYKHFTKKADKMRVICDFVAGMTDRYAVEFYSRLNSTNPESIFKPY
ncbi:MAG: deoxyguanosinetriphosphate triphosphohydrolase family protein [Rickettsiales bacterium]